MIDRIPSGTRQLDAVLGGGLPCFGISLIIGMPGSGKTILAQQYVFTNARPDRPALYLSTVSEPLEKILRYGQELTIFDPSMVGESVYYEDLGNVLHEAGLNKVIDHVRVLIREHRPAIVVIDSFKALHAYATDNTEFRRFLHNLAGILSAYPVTALWVGEYGEDEMALAPEFAVADAIVSLGNIGTGERISRVLQVFKLRGGDFLSGKHAYRLSAGGIMIFPRLADPRDPVGYGLDSRRVRSGIQALDDMLGNGFWSGSSTLLTGPTGIGKTIMGMNFALGGVHEGEHGVIATMQENPAQLERIAHQFGWSLAKDAVTLMYRSPVDLYLDEWVYELLDVIEATGATRVLVDSLRDLQAASPDFTRFREYLYSLVQRCSRHGVTLLMTYETPELVGLTRLSEESISHIVDNVVLLQYRGLEGVVSRTLKILKSRAAAHNSQVLEFEISSNGITLKMPSS